MKKCDVAIIGSGAGGTACAIILCKLGYKVTLIERGSHPRFALGESGTPALSRKMRFLGRAYGIPEFEAMATYDNIESSGIEVLCGPKEAFHYFVHRKGQTDPGEFGAVPEIIVHTSEMDVQYNRAAFDKKLLDVAISYGAQYYDHSKVENIEFNEQGALIDCRNEGKVFTVSADFVVDATGHNSVIGEKFGLKISGEDLETPLKSRSIFTHFKNIGSFDDEIKKSKMCSDGSLIPRSHATQHHCFDGGWVWFIPFDNGVTSVGINLDIDQYPENDKDPMVEFWEIANQYPIVAALLEGRENVIPFFKTGRMQFMNRELVGDRWAMLPASAYGLDGWFSTGLAATFLSVHRLVELLHGDVLKNGHYRREALLDYEKAIKKEYFHAAKMIHGVYKSFKHFEIFRNYCFLCFMGAESYLEKGGAGKGMDLGHLLLSAGDSGFIDKFNIIYDRVISDFNLDKIDAEEEKFFNDFIRNEMLEYNLRNFGDPQCYGVYPRRVAPMPEYALD